MTKVIPPLAISFSAFCTAGQKRSSTVTSHIEAAQAWCQLNGYYLEKYTEPASEVVVLRPSSPCLGGLYLIQYRLERGLIKPSTALIIEALDGVPRQELPKAHSVLQELIQQGLTVVTLVDNRVWDAHALSGLASFLMSVIMTYSMSSDSGPGLGGEGA